MNIEKIETLTVTGTRSETDFTSSGTMVLSKPWPDVVLIGQRILEELGQAETNHTLTRWMAHRIAELLEREETAKTPEGREEARQECADLILRLWGQRRDWPDKAPFAKILAALKPIMARPEYERWNSDKVPDSWRAMIPALHDITEEERHACWQAAVMELDPSELAEEIERAEKYGDSLDKEEQEILSFIVVLKQQRESMKDLSTLGKEELIKHFANKLKSINDKRETLFKNICSVPKLDSPEGGNQDDSG